MMSDDVCMNTTSDYTQADGTPYEAAQAATINRWASDLMDGTVYRRHAASAHSAIGYRPVLDRGAYSHAMATIGRMAGESDALAYVASRILGRVNLYSTRPEAAAAIWDAAAEAMSGDYLDVVGLAGPEPGRRSDRTHGWTLNQRVAVYVWLTEATAKMAECVPCVGWCAAAVARAANLPLAAHRFPSLGLDR